MNRTKVELEGAASKERKVVSAVNTKTRPETRSQEVSKQRSSKRCGTSPSPASYKIKSIFEVETKKIQNKSGYSIPSSKPYQKIAQKPDPWTYVPQDWNIKPNSPHATIGKQVKIQKQRDGPSPAHYLTNYNVVFHSVRRPVFGTEKRVVSRQNFAPGPANYDYLKSDAYRTYQRFVKIGTEKREYLGKQKKDIPARTLPLTEQINTSQRVTSILESEKRKDSLLAKDQNVKLKQIFLKIISDSNYNNDKEVVMRRTPAYTFQTSNRKQEKEALSPGPAAYFPAEHQEKGSIIGKSLRRLHSVTNFPGPEAYVIVPQQLSPSFSIPRAFSKDCLKEKTPGPGQYTPQLPESQKYRSISIGIGDRPPPAKLNNQPGPGQYDLVVRSTKGFSIARGERHQNREDHSPGPAHYFIDSSFVKSKSNQKL